MALKNYNNLQTSGRWYNNDTKDYQILDLVGVAQQIIQEPNKSPEKYNRE